VTTTPVVVVGGGIAGLSAAYELMRADVPFLLVEAGSRLGGVILSEAVDGFTIDGGPDSLLVQKPDGIRLAEELGLGPRLVATRPPRLSYVQRGGRLHALPSASVLGIPTRVGPFARTSLFTWPGKLRMGAEIFTRPPRDRGPDHDESIGAFMRRHFGTEAAEYLAEPLLAGIHAGDVDRLSLAALFPRLLSAESSHGSLLRAFRRQTHRVTADGAFRSLPDGLSELVRALEARLPATQLRVRTRVNGVRTGPGGQAYRVELADGTGIEARAVVLATPAYVTGNILRGTDPGLAARCDEIPYASTGTVALAFERSAVAHPLNGSGFVVPRTEGTGILAGSWLSSKWPHRAPDGKVLLRTFVGGARDPRALDLGDNELVARSLAALRPLLGITGDPLFTRVYRWERANAQHEVGHLGRVAAIDARLAAHPGLYVTGSGFRGVGIPDCVADGRATARQALRWLASGNAAVRPA
jgi:protoporphyrinogen/coproporphyrinogen III oxidase